MSKYYIVNSYHIDLVYGDIYWLDGSSLNRRKTNGSMWYSFHSADSLLNAIEMECARLLTDVEVIYYGLDSYE